MVIDFGAGTTVGGATLSGKITVNYTGTGSSGAIQMIFEDFTISSTGQSLRIVGTLNYVVSYSGSNATATLTGSLTITLDSRTSTISMNATFRHSSVAGAPDRAMPRAIGLSGTARHLQSSRPVPSR